MGEGRHAVDRDVFVRFLRAVGPDDAQGVDFVGVAQTEVQKQLVLGEVR